MGHPGAGDGVDEAGLPGAGGHHGVGSQRRVPLFKLALGSLGRRFVALPEVVVGVVGGEAGVGGGRGTAAAPGYHLLGVPSR